MVVIFDWIGYPLFTENTVTGVIPGNKFTQMVSVHSYSLSLRSHTTVSPVPHHSSSQYTKITV